MGLAVVRSFDPHPLFTAGNYDSAGIWLASNDGLRTHRWAYYDRLDFVVADALRSSPPTTARSFARFDPLLLSNVGTLFNQTPEPGSIGGTNCSDLAVDNWDRLANSQRIYAYAAGVATNPFNEVNPLALNQVFRLDCFPTMGAAQGRATVIGQVGHYRNADASWVFWEDWGFALCPSVDVVHTDAVERQNVCALVEIATGKASILPVVTRYSTTSPNEFIAPPVFGQTMQAYAAQFVGDDDLNTAAVPRGELWIFFGPDDSPADPTFQRAWVKVIDWNPFGVSGTPTRVHLRERLFSAVDFKESSGGLTNGIYESALTTPQVWYHPSSNSLVWYSKTAVGLSLDAGESKFLFVSTAPVATLITEPSRRSEVLTGKTVAFGVETIGSLNEGVAGVDVGFTLRRVSSVDEVLPVTPTPGETVAVANGPISPTDPVVSPVVVKENGAALTETTHYTVNRGAGTITFVAPKPLGGGAVYTASYRHFGTPAVPAHGSLLTAAAVSDLDGVAVAQVRYAEEDPVPDRWDRLDADLI